jgi:putative ABC transport system permease protein
MQKLCHAISPRRTEKNAGFAEKPSEPVTIIIRNRTESRTSVEFNEKHFYEDDIIYADNSIFSIYRFPMTIGDTKTALETAYSVVLTKETAKRYFGNENPGGGSTPFDNVL